MNSATQNITDFTFFISMIRDTMAYILYEDKDLVPLYGDQKHCIKTELEVESPINQVLSLNGDAGKLVKNDILKFYDFLFANEKYIEIVDKKVAVKHDLDTKACLYVTNALIALLPMVDQHIEEYKKENLLEKEAVELANRSKLHAVATVNMALYFLMEKYYFGFCKVKTQLKGGDNEETEAYVHNINTIIDMYSRLKNLVKSDDNELKNTQLLFDEVVGYFMGKRQIEAGQSLAKRTQQVRLRLLEFLQSTTKPYLDAYLPLIKEVYMLQEQERERLGK